MYPRDGPSRVRDVELRFALSKRSAGTRHAAFLEIQATGLLVRLVNSHDVQHAVMKMR